MAERVSLRYAKALFELAKERNEMEQILSDAQYLIVLCYLNKDFKIFINSPIIKPAYKIQVLQTAFKGSMNELILSFIRLLLKKNRIVNIAEMMVIFIRMYKKEKNIHTIKLKTVDEISDELKQKFKEILQKQFGGTIELITTEDSGLIGGYTIQYGDKLMDYSLNAKFLQLKRAFSENKYKKGI